jgi:hypothetical protein
MVVAKTKIRPQAVKFEASEHMTKTQQKNGREKGGENVRGGRRSRDKGARCERAAVLALQDAGVPASRVPLSGAAGGAFAGDVLVPVLGRDLRFEVKARASGFKKIYQWLSGNSGLFVRADRQGMLAVVPVGLLAELIAAANAASEASNRLSLLQEALGPQDGDHG